MHCANTDDGGANQFNPMSALERWREQNIAPNRIIASHVTNGVVDTTRPLCPYPQVAVYSGDGSTKDAANFSCKAPQLTGSATQTRWPYEAENPVRLFDSGIATQSGRARMYAVTPDGNRFLLAIPRQRSTPTPITVMVNWLEATRAGNTAR